MNNNLGNLTDTEIENHLQIKDGAKDLIYALRRELRDTLYLYGRVKRDYDYMMRIWTKLQELEFDKKQMENIAIVSPIIQEGKA
jgi:hypothetical protein